MSWNFRVGKSTFLQLLTGAIQPTEGNVEVGETVTFGYYKQMGLDMTEKQREMSVIRYLQVVMHSIIIFM